MAQLFRRVLFNVRIGNRDDHLRNHGFIRVKTGWRLAPAYDINPNPYKAAHTLTLDGYTTEPDVGAAMACAELYRVNDSEARKILQEIDAALGDWQLTASQLGLARSDIARMAAVIQN
nr:HipA domain-containing protein [Roseateles terrae]